PHPPLPTPFPSTTLFRSAEPVYIDALAASLNTALAKLAFKPEMIIASYHGMPEDYVAKGDPYSKQCTETTALLRKKLKLSDERLDRKSTRLNSSHGSISY